MKQSVLRNLKVSTQLTVLSLFEKEDIGKIERKPIISNQMGFFGITFILIVVIMLALGGATLWVKNKVDTLEREKLELKVTNEELIAANARITEINERNVLTISQLLSDKKRGDVIVNQLKSERQKYEETLASLRKKVKVTVKNDPTKDGPIAPVLRDTIQDILNTRYPPLVKKDDKK